MLRLAGPSWVAAAAILLVACPDAPVLPLAPPIDVKPARAGVKVPLPDGWTAKIAADQSFRAGPIGHAVLRIDLRPGAGDALPSLTVFEEALTRELPGVSIERVEQKSGNDCTVLRYVMRPLGAAAAGPGAAAPAMIGAKRVGNDLFLCASIPGASVAEVAEAVEACAALDVG